MLTRKEKEAKPLFCPFCGAPHGEFIPQGTVQVKCKYCGRMVLVPPWMSGETHRCYNHPEKLVSGRCNDCGESFCGECLRVYNLKTRDAEAILYLCSNCLRRRYAEDANKSIFSGVMLLFLGLFSTLVMWPFGILILLLGLGVTIYGLSQKARMPKELTIDELQAEEEKRKTELASLEGVGAQEIYDKLLVHYVDKWGPRIGVGLLEEEIRAYTSCGASYAEAVKNVYRRQEKGLRNT